MMRGSMAYPRLFEPFEIGNLHLKNRIAMAPMETHLGEPDGGVNNEIIAYYRERARGGAGLIITEFTCVDGTDGFSSNVPQLRLDNDRYKAGHARLVAAIHAAGAKAVIQISHAGRQTKESVIGRQPLSSSPVPIKGLDIPMIRIGDAAQVARIGEAVRDAYRAVQDLRRLIIRQEPIAC